MYIYFLPLTLTFCTNMMLSQPESIVGSEVPLQKQMFDAGETVSMFVLFACGPPLCFS